MLNAPILIIQLNGSSQYLAIIKFFHYLHQFMFDTPRGVVANAQLTL
jgi:hypothetical protein